MKSTTLLLVGIGAAAVLYLALRKPATGTGKLAAPKPAPGLKDAAVDAGMALASKAGKALLDWYNTPSSAVPVGAFSMTPDPTGVGDFESLGG